MNTEYEFELIQDGISVASASSTDRGAAFREIQHYAMMYEQDGPVEIKEISPCAPPKK